MEVYPHPHQNRVIFGVNNNGIKTNGVRWSYSDYWDASSFAAFLSICHSLQHMPSFTAVVLACPQQVSSLYLASPHVPCWECEEDYVLLLTCNVKETKNQCKTMQRQQNPKSLHFLGWVVSFCWKSTKTLANYIMTLLPLAVLFRIYQRTCRRDYSCGCSAREINSFGILS